MTLSAPLSKEFAEYEAAIASARYAFATSPALLQVVDPNADPKFLTAFLLYFSALGVAMTKPVDSWIFRAGEASKDRGFEEIGEALCLHARHEAGHHLMMIEDTKALAKVWNSYDDTYIEAEDVLALRPTTGVIAYTNLHEEVIAEAPFAQIAIELEIENLSITLAPSLIANCKKILGEEISEGLSFIEEHAAIDVSHTHFNEKQMDKFLAEYPECFDDLVESGQKALRAYALFISNCVGLAHWLVAD